MVNANDLIAKFQYSLDEHWGYIYGATHEMWSEEKQAAYVKQYSKNEKRKLSCEYGGKWAGHWVTDCSGLFAYWMKVLGGYMYHGSNTMYKSYCTSKGKLSKGKRTDGQPLKPGTAVFTGSEDKHGHVGLYIGDGWVIEAEGSKAGVVKSKVTISKWTFWGELKGVSYGEGGDIVPDPVVNLKRGSKGDAVKELQKKLIALGYDLGSYGADGAFGQATEKAVKQFQLDHGLAADGIAGEKTLAALNKPAAETYTVTIQGLTKEQADALAKSYPKATVRRN